MKTGKGRLESRLSVGGAWIWCLWCQTFPGAESCGPAGRCKSCEQVIDGWSGLQRWPVAVQGLMLARPSHLIGLTTGSTPSVPVGPRCHSQNRAFPPASSLRSPASSLRSPAWLPPLPSTGVSSVQSHPGSPAPRSPQPSLCCSCSVARSASLPWGCGLCWLLGCGASCFLGLAHGEGPGRKQVPDTW